MSVTTPPPENIEGSGSQAMSKATSLVGNNKWMLGLGSIGLILGVVAKNPIFRFLATIVGLALGAVKDGAKGMFGKYLPTPYPLNIPGANRQNQNTQSRQTQQIPQQPPAPTRFADAVSSAVGEEDAREKLVNTLTAEFQDTVSVKKFWGGRMIDKHAIRIGDHWIVTQSDKKAEQLAGLIGNYYKRPEFRQYSAQDAARLIANNPDILDTLGVGKTLVYANPYGFNGYGYGGGFIYSQNPRKEQNSQAMRDELHKYIMQNHGAISQAMGAGVATDKATQYDASLGALGGIRPNAPNSTDKVQGANRR